MSCRAIPSFTLATTVTNTCRLHTEVSGAQYPGKSGVTPALNSAIVVIALFGEVLRKDSCRLTILYVGSGYIALRAGLEIS